MDEVIRIKTVVEDHATKALMGIKTALGAAFGAFTIAAIANTTVKLVALASAAEEVRNKFDVVFGKSDKITRNIEILAKKTGYAVSSLQEMTSSLAALIKPAGFSAEKTYELSEKIAQLSLDLGSFMNLQPQDIVRDFQSALAGSSETLQKYGIDARETTLAQTAFNMGLIDSTKNYEKLDPEQKRHVRTLALIEKSYRDTGSAQGDLARTSNSYANQLRTFSESVKVLGENLGKLLMPALTNIVSTANDGIKWIQGFIDTITKSDLQKQIDQMKNYGAAIEDVNKAIQQKTLFELGNQLIEAEKKLSDAVKNTNQYFAQKVAGLKVVNMDFDTYIKLQEESEKLKQRIIERSKEEFDIMMAQHKAGVQSTQTTTDWSKALIEQKNVIDNLLSTFDNYISLEEQIDQVRDGAIDTLKKETFELGNNTNAINDTNKELRENLELLLKIKMAQSQPLQGEIRTGDKKAQDEQKKRYETQFDTFQSYQEAMLEYQIKNNQASYDDLTKFYDGQLELLQTKGLQYTSEYVGLLDKRNEAKKRSMEIQRGYVEAELEGFKSITSNMADAFYQFADQSKESFETYKAFSIAETIISTYEAAQKAFAAMAGIPVIGPSLGTAAAVAAVAAGLARVAAISQQEYQGRAQGGSVQAGMPYIVGERGREAFIPNVSGNIISNAALKRMGGKTVNIYVSAIDTQSFRDFLRRGGAGVLESEVSKGRLF